MHIIDWIYLAIKMPQVGGMNYTATVRVRTTQAIL